MAGCDYLTCAVCDKRVLYDAELDYDYSAGKDGDLHDIAAICKECAKTHSLQVASHPCAEKIADFWINQIGE